MKIAPISKNRVIEIYNKLCVNVEKSDESLWSSSSGDWISRNKDDYLWSKAEEKEYTKRREKLNKAKQNKANSEAYRKKRDGI